MLRAVAACPGWHLEATRRLSWLGPFVQRCIMRSCWVPERGACVSSAKREVAHSTAARGYAGAYAGYIWNPSVTATGCLMILGMLVALPFALKLPKQAKWLKDTPPGRVRSYVFLCCSDTSWSSPSCTATALQKTACKRNSTALLGLLPEACLGDLIRYQTGMCRASHQPARPQAAMLPREVCQ